MSWFGVVACISAPELTKMRCASMTNALNDLSLMMTTCTFCWASPATRRIGCEYSRSSCSISASRIIGMPALDPVCARAGALAQRDCGGGGQATAREAGLAGRALLGGLATIMWDKVSVPGPGPKLWMEPVTVNTGPARCWGEAERAQNPANTAAAGQFGAEKAGDRPGRQLMLERAKILLRPSARSAVPPFMVMDVMAAAARLEAQGRRIIHMEVGQPAAGRTGNRDRRGARRAVERARLGYTETLGIASLRRRIARAYAEWHGLDIDPARIVVTTGSSAGFILAFLAAFDAGDRVAMALPGYPPYRHILTALGCEPVGIETTAQTRWSITGRDAARATSSKRRSRA